MMTKAHILILEDDQHQRDTYLEIVNFFGYQGTAVTNGEKGVAAVKTAIALGKPFDIYLSDVQMPKLDGPGFYEQVKSLASTPIVFHSMGMSDGQKVRLEQLQPFRLIEKPVNFPILKETLEQALLSYHPIKKLADQATHDFSI